MCGSGELAMICGARLTAELLVGLAKLLLCDLQYNETDRVN
jgi:hypothetical protein